MVQKMLHWINVESTAIEAVAMNDAMQEVCVRYVGGREYSFRALSEDEYNAGKEILMDAIENGESIGRTIGNKGFRVLFGEGVRMGEDAHM